MATTIMNSSHFPFSVLPMTNVMSPQDLSPSPANSPETRPTLPGRSRSSSLLHRNILSRMRPLPFQYVFSFWHTKSTNSSEPTCLADSVPDIAAFYKIYNNFPWDSLATKDGVYFFRSGVQPLWEDEENLNGGCWTIKVRKDDSKALKTWEELCLMVCGGELQSVVAKERDHVLGISYSPRPYVAHISIWTRNGDNRGSVETLQKTILSRLSSELRPTSELDYYYKKHSEHVGWEEAVRPKQTCSLGQSESKVEELKVSIS